MILFGKQRQQVADKSDHDARLGALENHQDYMQEQLEYTLRQLEKRLKKLEESEG